MESTAISRTASPKPLSLDIADPVQAARFPRHGWAYNSQRTKLLWLPIKGLLSNPQVVRRSKGITEPIRLNKKLSPVHEQTYVAIPVNHADRIGQDIAVTLQPGPLSTAPFYHSLHDFALILAEIQSLIRRRQEIPIESSSAEHLDAVMQIHDKAALHIKWAFVELRSLLDLVAFHARPVLFDSYGKAPGKFQELMKKVRSEKEFLSGLAPFIDLDQLERVLEESVQWYDLLRDPGGRHKGIRDELVHCSTRIIVGSQAAGEGPAELTAHFSHDPKRELVSTLREMVAGFSKLCTDMHVLVALGAEYSRGDYMPLWGNNEDFTGFWEEI